MDCGKCGVVSGCYETLGGHFKTFHFAFVVCDVRCEMCIFVTFLCVPIFDVLLGGACELKQADGFCLLTILDEVSENFQTASDPPLCVQEPDEVKFTKILLFTL